jgi:hypothetical protein
MEPMAARSDRAYVAARGIIEDVDRLVALSSTLKFVSAELGDCGLPRGRATDRSVPALGPVCYNCESDPLSGS